MARLAIRMPKMSMTMTEGEVSSWLVKIGDAVNEGDVVCEVMTDKVDMDVESSVSGTLVEIVVESGMADVGVPIGWVEGEDTGGGFGDLLTSPEPTLDEPATPEAPTASPPVAESDEPADGSPTVAGPVAAVPRARGLATERGLDLSTVTGTGPDGLVLVSDVEAMTPAATTPVPVGKHTPQPEVPTAPANPMRATAVPTGKASDRRASIRGAVARTMTPTALIPQFTVWREIELDAADAQRRGLSWTTVLLRAYAGALRKVPELLSRWEDDRPTEAGPPSIALAVATDRGLLVPTFSEPDLGNASEVDAEIRAVVGAAHTGRLDAAHMGIANGSFSNLGGMRVDRFQALLTPPQASVLSLGSIRQRPVAVPGGVGLALTVEAGITVDHRVADGAHGGELLDRFARLLGGRL